MRYYDKQDSGIRIRELRISCGFTLEELAEQVEIDKSHLSRIEQGTKGCSLRALGKMCDLFHVTPDYLAYGIGSENESEEDDSLEKLRQEVESIRESLKDCPLVKKVVPRTV